MINEIWSTICALGVRLRDSRGASMVEYALLVVLIAIIALVGVELAGSELSEQYSHISSGLEGANSQN